jgi:amidophosphoribosyltransferase
MIPDKLHEECGIFGIYGHPEASNLTYLGLHSLQHRGQEGSGIVSTDGETLYCEKGMGLVSEIFNDARLSRLPGRMAIGHNRYSTYGESVLKNVQPLLVNYALGGMAISHNGNLVNAAILRDELEAYGAIFQSSIDTEVIVHLIAQSKEATFFHRVVDALKKVRGAYSLLILTENEMIAVRDSYGFRPLSLAMKDGAYVVASESCAFDLIEAEFIRDVQPGEVLVINQQGMQSHFPFPVTREAACVFEYIYFSRPDSEIFGENVNLVRKRMGRQLAKETGVSADLVIPVPDSGVPAALGYAEGAGLPYDNGLIRSHYVGRTFIEPQQTIRHFGVKLKLNPVREVLRGKRVVVVDDSLVRGTTSQKLVQMLRDAGAREVHLRIASPPVLNSCFYGIDTPTRRELIATEKTTEEIRRFIKADTLGYLSIEGMLTTLGAPPEKFCAACFDGRYPVPFTEEELVQLGLFGGTP